MTETRPTDIFAKRRLRVVSLGLLGLLVIAPAASAQLRSAPEIRDTAEMFGKDAVARAKAELERIALRTSVPTVIETIEALRGQTIDEAASRNARQSDGQGIYVLAARRDHKIEVVVPRGLTGRIPDAKRLAIRGAFVEGFKDGDFDAGLEKGIQMIGSFLGADQRLATSSERDREDGPSELVLRNQVRLTLAGARRIIAGAEAKAADLGVKFNIAVVDDGGHAIAFERMDGARPASGYTASTKAVTAATFRAPTGPVPSGTTNPDPLLNLSLQNAAFASGGKVTTLLGGLPVIVNDQVIGGVGVGGGSGEQDTTVARAGIDAFLADLKEPRAK